MHARKSTLGNPVVWLLHLFSGFFCLGLARGQGYLTPTDVVMPPEKASQEVVGQTAAKATLRFGGLDVFPHAAVSAVYDDNLFISHENTVSDLEWSLAPGLTMVAGDVSTYLPGSVTLSQVRDLLDYSLVEDSAKPQRFAGVDYTPSINLFTDHDANNNVDHFAGLSAGYAFSRLAVGLDQDFSRVADKANEVGSRVVRTLYETKLRTRYEFSDRSNLEVNGKYTGYDYAEARYQGFQEVKNEDWFNRQMGAKVSAGLGVVFGFVFPEINADQTYQQVLLRGIYRLTGKLDVRLMAGGEYREYENGRAATIDPVFGIAAIYQPSERTTLTLDGHRMDQPSPFGDYNYVTLGVYAGVRQTIVGSWSVGLSGGYDSIEYVRSRSSANGNRSDGYLSLRASVDYDMNSHIKWALFYILRQNDSTSQNYEYENNMVGLQVTWRL